MSRKLSTSLADTKSVDNGSFTDFKLSRFDNSYSFSVWDVTDPLNVTQQLMAWDNQECLGLYVSLYHLLILQLSYVNHFF